jgi:hypothetical protein
MSMLLQLTVQTPLAVCSRPMESAPGAQVSRVKSEEQRYLEQSAAPMNTDPLEWWSSNEINFPVLIVM